MGTRNLTAIVKDGEYKVAQYCQWDGYPAGQGLEVLHFLRDEMNRVLFEQKLSQVSFATQEDLTQMWVEAGANPKEQFVTLDVSNRFRDMYPENSRDTGAEILAIIQNSERPLKISSSIDFVEDSLFCEWAYVVDLDKNTFEVYRGFNQEPLSEGERFYKEEPNRSGYYPVKLIATFELDKLPADEVFLDVCEEKEESA